MTYQKASLPIYSAAILLGITAISGQIVLMRELFTTLYGNELSIGFVLALWLLGGAIGSGILASIFIDKIKRTGTLFFYLEISLAVLLPASIVFARVSRGIFGISPGEIINLSVFLAIAQAALLPVAIVLGFLFVLMCKMLRCDEPALNINRIYALEAAGAAIGGVVTSLVLVRFLGTIEIGILVSFLCLLSSLILAAKKERFVSVFLILALGLFAIFGGVDALDKKSTRLKWKGFRVLESKNSIYGETAITQKNGQFNLFSNGLFLFSSHDPLAAEEIVHFTFSANPLAKKILLIGGGSSGITAEVLKYEIESIDYVELDPLIISFSKKFLKDTPGYRLDSSRVNIITEDGRYFIKNTKKTYDIVIISLPNPYTAQINRFYTEEFFGELKKVLAEKAVVSFGVTSSENYLSREQALFLKTLLDTARSEFREVKIIPGDTAYFLMSDEEGLITLDHRNIVKALESEKIHTTYVREYYLFSKLSKERLEYTDEALELAGRVEKNKDFHPVSYFYDMVLWSTIFSFKFAKILLLLTRETLLYVAVAAFLIFWLVFFVRRKKKSFTKEVTLFALCTTGLSEISFEILIVLAFQVIYGYLYYKIGIIVTSFMLGLGLGSAYMLRRLKNIKRPLIAYTKIQALVFVYPIFLIFSFAAFSRLSLDPAFNRISANIFSVLPFVAGFVGGLQFPLANKICLGDSNSIGKTAGKTYAVDLAGSFLGALLISTLVIPIIGIYATCVAVALLNLLSLILLLYSTKRVSWLS